MSLPVMTSTVKMSLPSHTILDGAEALHCNLVGEVLPADLVMERAYQFAHLMANERSPVATVFIRQMMYRNSSLPHPLQAPKVKSLGMLHASLGDGKEGVASFMEKRPPEFTARASKMPDFYPW